MRVLIRSEHCSGKTVFSQGFPPPPEGYLDYKTPLLIEGVKGGWGGNSSWRCEWGTLECGVGDPMSCAGPCMQVGATPAAPWNAVSLLFIQIDSTSDQGIMSGGRWGGPGKGKPPNVLPRKTIPHIRPAVWGK